MSFFYDFLKSLAIDDLSSDITITTIVGHGIMVVGNFRVKEIGSDLIVVSSGKEKISISGKSLSVLTLAKGEIAISGRVENIALENKNG